MSPSCKEEVANVTFMQRGGWCKEEGNVTFMQRGGW